MTERRLDVEADRYVARVYGRAVPTDAAANYFMGLGPFHLMVMPARRLLELAVGQWWAQLVPAARRQPHWPDELPDPALERHYEFPVGPLVLVLHRIPEPAGPAFSAARRRALDHTPRIRISAILRSAAQTTRTWSRWSTRRSPAHRRSV